MALFCLLSFTQCCLRFQAVVAFSCVVHIFPLSRLPLHAIFRHLFIYSKVDGPIWSYCTHCSENIPVQESWHTYACILKGMSEKECLSHRVCSYSALLKNAKLFSKEVVTVYIPSGSLWEFLLIHRFTDLCPSDGQGWAFSSLLA